MIGDIRASDAYPGGDNPDEGDAWAAQSIAESLNKYGKARDEETGEALEPVPGMFGRSVPVAIATRQGIQKRRGRPWHQCPVCSVSPGCHDDEDLQ
jgi:hypothetical protein